MHGPAIRCPSCGHALFTIDQATTLPASPSEQTRLQGALPSGTLLLRIAEAAELLSISRSSFYQLVASGRVSVVRIGRTVRVPRRELERLAEEGSGL